MQSADPPKFHENFIENYEKYLPLEAYLYLPSRVPIFLPQFSPNFLNFPQNDFKLIF